ncbi:MAG: MlaD family protein [bacterium]
MRKVSSEVAAGVAIFLAFVIFVTGYLYLKDLPFRGGRFRVTAHFADVTGLEKSDFVSVSGLKIGRVKSLHLKGLEVLAILEFNPGVELPRDSRARIKSIGMVGEKFIDIIPGTSKELLQEGDVIEGSNSGDITDLSTTMEGLMGQAQQLITRLTSLLDIVFDNETQKNLKESIYHLRNVAAALDKNSDRTAVHLQNVLANLDSLSTVFNELFVDRRESLKTSLDNFNHASASFQTITDKLDTSLNSMQTLLAKIENQDGALGKVIASDDLYNDIRHLTAELDDLVQDLKKRPQRYVNLGFIKIF